MSFPVILREPVPTELEESLNDKVSRPFYYDDARLIRRCSWFPNGRMYNPMCYGLAYTYRVRKKPIFSCLTRSVSVTSRVIVEFLTTLSYVERGFESHFGSGKLNFMPLVPLIDYEETNQLSNIDGYAATTGVRTRIILRADLTPDEKEQGKRELLRKVQSKNEPAVFLWKLGE